MHGARLVKKDVEFCRQPRKRPKSALCRLVQCSWRCQIPLAGLSPGVRLEDRLRQCSVQPAAEDLIIQQFHKPVCLNLSIPPFSPSPSCFLQAPTHDQQPVSSFGGLSFNLCTLLSAPLLSLLHPFPIPLFFSSCFLISFCMNNPCIPLQ